MHNRAYHCLLNTFEAILNRKLVHLNFLPLRRSVPCLFPLLRMVFGSTTIISLSAVVDGSSLLASAIADQFGF